jgi:protein-L-isoaspartate(D-aspartate) O-methyltransferase
VGTGSGYQAAVLAECAKQVYSIEIIEELGKSALERLNRLGIRNVQVRVGDGYHGWEEHAPYDGIVVTAAGSHIPPPLVRQLKPGGGRGFASASGTQAMAGRVTLQARA